MERVILPRRVSGRGVTSFCRIFRDFVQVAALKSMSMLLRTTLLLATLSTGCHLLIADEGLEDTRSGFHDVTVNWRLMNLDGTVMSACPQGFSTLVTHLYHDGYVEPPDGLVKTPCTPEGSLTQTVPTGGLLPDPDDEFASFSYDPQKDIWIDVTEETQLEFAARSYVYYIENLDSDVTIDFDIYPAGGVGVAAWTLSSSFTTAPIPSCATAEVDQVEAAVRRYDAGEDAPFTVAGTWPCEQVDPYFYYDPDGNSTTLDSEYELGSGHTAALEPGDYEVEMRAKRSGAVVGTSTGYFTADPENGYHNINDDPIMITDR
ncbi:MAG TPA: hypothetical protein VK698_19260 [Kofleriaceae bacterium]|nr:hypothetical protein [Kofleriaceae bacterium]